MYDKERYDREKRQKIETILAMAAALTAAGYGDVRFKKKKGDKDDA